MAENVIVLPVTKIERETLFDPPDLVKRLQWAQSDCIDDEKPGIASLLGEAIAEIEKLRGKQ